jgi:NAD(P)H-hydrate epimerase
MMEPLVTAAEMRAFDRHTIEVVGVPAIALMESAGRAVADAVMRLGDDRVVVVAGKGNNGGDGLVAARTLQARGRAVEVLLLDEESALTGDPASCLRAARAAGVPVTAHVDEATLRGALQRSAIVVDAIFGTGLARAVDGASARAIDLINRSGCRVVAVDVPSGLDADRGVPLGNAVRATVTVTFAFGKRGLYGSPGFTYAGRIERADIGIAASLAAEVKTRVIGQDVLAPFQSRDPLGHKGTHGHVLLVAGSVGKIGAALLAGRAALRAGAGLCTLAAPQAAQTRIEGHLPELMTFGYPGAEPGSAGLDATRAAAALTAELNGKRVVALGPGVPTAPAFAEVTERLVYAAVAEGLAVVLDADGLNHLAHRPSVLVGRPGDGPIALTPHPGEAARLLGGSVASIEADRFGAALALAERFQAIVALKGARTVVASPDGRFAVCVAGGPLLGVGGTGDVLTGTVAALLANRRAPAFETVCAAVQLHATAADRLAARLTAQRGLLASELADAIPESLTID